MTSIPGFAIEYALYIKNQYKNIPNKEKSKQLKEIVSEKIDAALLLKSRGLISVTELMEILTRIDTEEIK